MMGSTYFKNEGWRMEGLKRQAAVLFFVLALVVFFGSGCTTEVLQMGPNGDARLRYLEIKGVSLIPSFSPTVMTYAAVVNDPASAQVLVAPFVYFTKFTVNEQLLAMNTNVYGLPTYTPFNMTGLTNLRVVTRAEDGLSRIYTVTLLDRAQVDAGLTGVSSTVGLIVPSFKEGSAPGYVSYQSGATTNLYSLVITNVNYRINLLKQAVNADLTVNGSVYGAGVALAAVDLVHPGSGTQVVVVTNVSPNGMFTNVKTFNVTYANPATDARAQDVRFYNAASGEEITYTTTFSPNKMGDYSLVLDNCNTVRVAVTPVQSTATVSVIRATYDAVGVYSIQNTYTNADLNNIPCEMGDRITVRIQQGASQKNYVWYVTKFTSTVGYGFSGGIGDFLRFIHEKKEYGQATYMSVTGIVTFDVAGDDGFFIEDGEYGLYIWAGWYSKPVGLKVGQKVRVDFKYAKLWMGFAEVAYSAAWQPNQVQTTILNRKPRDIYYQTTPQWYSLADPVLEIYRHAARMVRYQTTMPIVSGFDSSWTGQFTPSYSFKLAEDYGNVEYTRTYSAAVRYMKEGVNGTFFGPLLYDGTMYMYIAHPQFMIIPWEDRAPE